MSSNNTQTIKKPNILFYLLIGITTFLLGLLLIGSISIYFLYKPVMANYYYSKGIDYKDLGDIFNAKKNLVKAIKMDPGSKTSKQAEQYLKTHLPLSDNITEKAVIQNNYGYNANMSRDYDKAIMYYKESIKLSPEFEWPYSNLATIYYYEKNDPKEAINLLKTALKLNPNFFNAQKKLADIYFDIALKFYRLKNYPESMKNFELAKQNYQILISIEKGFEKQKKEINDKISALDDYIKLAKKNINPNKDI